VAARGPLAIVDLETTGLPSDRSAEILEFGVLLLDAAGSRVEARTLQTLVKPSAPLPPAIQRLTGLHDDDVADAPSLEKVAHLVSGVLEGRVIVAHNADFEREFLSRFVSRKLADASYLDTQDLLALTHPDAPDLRLESFTRMLLASEERHRALDDALDTARVLARVAEGAAAGESRYVVASRALERYAPDSPWRELLGEGLPVPPAEEPEQFIAIAASEDLPVPFDEDAIARVLRDQERGARYFPGYRVREEQVDLARHFARNLARGGTLLLEGGTGVGKSLAYLSAAIPFALEQAARGLARPVVISTRTKLLQDQLLRKDIAAAARFLGHPELRAMSIKGRANYVCERRLEAVLAEGRELGIFEEQRLAYAVLMSCARTRSHGEVGALPAALLRRYPSLRDLLRKAVAARAQQCSREDCAKTPGCPFGRRRQALAKAHLVVANHDLLLRWPPDYPDFGHVIADEGHELAGVADEVYAVTVRPEEVLEVVDEIFGKPSAKPSAKSSAKPTAKSSAKDGGEALLPRKQRRSLAVDVAAWRRELYHDFSEMGRSLAGRASDYGEVQLPIFADRVFPEVAELAEHAAQRIEGIAAQAEALDVDSGSEAEESAVAKSAGDLREAADGLRMAFSGADESVASFERVESPYDRWRLAIRSVSPGSAFQAGFTERLDSFAAVSASLFVGGDAFAAMGELEIEERAPGSVEAVSVESPFPYAENMRVVALRSADDLVEETAMVIASLARELGGRTLGLFTSLRRMNEVAERLDQLLRGEGFEVLAPRRAADDPAALVRRFAGSGGDTILLGARTFWQGLDLPGDGLQAVVIEKLPFEVPTELRKRRETRIKSGGGDAFGRFTLGKMLLHLKQMAGRLIRSETDRGIVVIVESRSDKRYFRRLADAFPSGSEIRLAERTELPAILAELGLGG